MPQALGEQTEAQLVAGFRQNPDHFTEVYDRYFHDIYRYVAGRLDVQEADDLAAETFLIAFRTRDRFDPARGTLRPWLFGIATNLIARHRRRETQHYRALAKSGIAPPADSHENRVVAAVAASAAYPEVARALAGINQGERDVLLLLALGQLGHEEIAAALGISYGTVGSRLSRARKKLRDLLEER